MTALRRRVEKQKRESSSTPPGNRSLRDSVLESIHEIESAYLSGGRNGCIRTGFSGLDRLTGGARPGELMVIASVSGVGKSMLALNIANHVAQDCASSVAFFSLESSRLELTQRLLCSQSGVSLNRVRSGRISPNRDFPRLEQAAARLAGRKILMEDPLNVSLKEIRQRIRELSAAHELKLVVIDPIQLLCGPGGEEDAVNVARELKRCAREFGIVVVALAPLDTPPAGRELGRPTLADLKGMRVLEHHADLVVLLWRQDFFEMQPEDYDADFSRASLIVAKNRHGALGEVPLLFRKEVPRFENRALEKAES